jgi:SAM-dependent methyltransferase
MTERDPIVDAVASYYSGKVREHGPSARGVDWNGEESQRLRFQQLMTVAGDDEHFSLNDYGSGYGALAAYIDEAGLDVAYTGFDVSQAMLDSAHDLFGERAGRRFVGDAGELEPADYTVASGVFNVKLDTPDAAWHEYVEGIVRRLAALSRKGLAFNMLTSYSDADRMRPDLHYADPLAWFDWCKRNLSRHVALLHDYGLYEFTIIVRLDPDTTEERP